MGLLDRVVSWARPGKQAKIVRTAEEFDVGRLRAALDTPLYTPAAFAWQLEQIRTARDLQYRGIFKEPARLARHFASDDALFMARRNRLAPLRALDISLVPANTSSRAQAIADEATALYGKDGIGFPLAAQASIHEELADHGVAFGVIDARPREDGSRIDLFLRHWPIQWVRWDPIRRCFVTQIDPASVAGDVESRAHPELQPGRFEVPIVHGDGRWVIFAKHESEPWKSDACVIPGAMVWAARAFALRDWAQNAQAHGAAKMFGELPQGVDILDETNGLSKQAQAFLGLLQDVMTGASLTGIRPAGSKTEFVANGSTNWQVFTELVGNRGKAAAWIYLGSDAVLGAQGGAPGVDISQLFGVSTTILQGDTSCFHVATYTGLLQPWAAMNFGDSRLAPRRLFQLADPDAEAVRDNFAKRMTAFFDAIGKLRERGFTVTQAVVNELAARFVVPAPVLPEESKRAPSIALAPTDLATAVSVNEARASAGLGRLQKPLAVGGGDDPDGDLPLSAYRAKIEARANPPAPAPAAKPNGAAAAA